MHAQVQPVTALKPVPGGPPQRGRGAADASGAARGREHPHLPRGGGRVRQAAAHVLHRQGLLGPAAPGPQGVLPRPHPVPAAAHRHRLEVQGDDFLPRRDREAPQRRAHRPHQRGRQGRGRHAVHARRALHRHHEDRGAQAGARQVRLRRRHRRRAPRRRKVPRQGARVQLPRCAASLGSEEPAPRALESLQRPAAPRRQHPRVPAVELDRGRHLDLHPHREHSGGAAVLRQAASRSSIATGSRSWSTTIACR